MKSRMIQKVKNPKKVVTPFDGDFGRKISWREYFNLTKKYNIERTRGYRIVILGSIYGIENGIELSIPKGGYNRSTHRKFIKLEKENFNRLGQLYDPVTFEKLE